MFDVLFLEISQLSTDPGKAVPLETVTKFFQGFSGVTDDATTYYAMAIGF